jgi:hypothetical protein
MGGIAVGIDRTGKPPRRVDGVGGQVGKLGNVPSDKGAVGVGFVCGGGNVGAVRFDSSASR